MNSAEWLEGEAAGLIFLDGHGKLVLANDIAGAWVRGGTLRIGAVRGALRGDRSSISEVSGFAARQGLHTVVMEAGRDWHFSAQSEPGVAVVILFIRLPSSGAGSSRAGVLDSYGLTQAEARVALAAADGAISSEIATKLQLSRNTIKTHLRRVYEKMGIRRQAELVRVLAG